MTLSAQVSGSTVLGAALSLLFPGAKQLGSGATATCFYVDVSFPLEPHILSRLEDRIRNWIREDLPFIEKEMVLASAVAFCHHRGGSIDLKDISPTSLISLVEFADFVSLSSGKHLSSTGRMPFLKLCMIKEYGGWSRIIGTSASSKEELKQQTAICKNIFSHLDSLKELPLLQPADGGWMWLPAGDWLRHQIMQNAWKHVGMLDGITTPLGQEESAHVQYVQTTGHASWEVIKNVHHGNGRELLDPKSALSDLVFFLAEEERTVAFLKGIAQFLESCSFSFDVVFVGKASKFMRNSIDKSALQVFYETGGHHRVEFRILDGIGRLWVGPTVCHIEPKGVIKSSLFHSWERFVALFLEQGGKKSTGWMAECMERLRETVACSMFRKEKNRVG